MKQSILDYDHEPKKQTSWQEDILFWCALGSFFHVLMGVEIFNPSLKPLRDPLQSEMTMICGLILLLGIASSISIFRRKIKGEITYRLRLLMILPFVQLIIFILLFILK